MLGKFLAGLLMGVFAAFSSSTLLALSVEWDTATAATVGPMIALAVVVVLGLTARRPAVAWGRGMLLCGLMSLALLARLITFAVAGILDLGQPGSEPFAAVDNIGAAMLFGVGGLIFLVPGYLLLRRKPSKPDPGREPEPEPEPVAGPPRRIEPRL